MNKIDSFMSCSDEHYQLCKMIFKVLNCNSLWIMSVDNNLLNVLATDQSILEYYLSKKYYLFDPNINKPFTDRSLWKVTLGTDCEVFRKNGFLYDLYKIFDIEEFVSIEKRIGTKHYCFRFFTKNNRFVFMNRLVNDMPIIKYFINAMTEKFNEIGLGKQPGVSVMELNKTKLKG